MSGVMVGANDIKGLSIGDVSNAKRPTKSADEIERQTR